MIKSFQLLSLKSDFSKNIPFFTIFFTYPYSNTVFLQIYKYYSRIMTKPFSKSNPQENIQNVPNYPSKLQPHTALWQNIALATRRSRVRIPHTHFFFTVHQHPQENTQTWSRAWVVCPRDKSSQLWRAFLTFEGLLLSAKLGKRVIYCEPQISARFVFIS